MTEVRGSDRSGLDSGEAADGSSDGPRDVAMEMVTAVISIAAETAGEDWLLPIDRTANGNLRRSCEVLATAWALRD
jgi:hypothetical protein